jgi:transcription elongation factor GreA
MNRSNIVERIPITPAGYGALKEKVRRLKGTERHEVIRTIQEARAHGDITENAEFEAAKERQAFLEATIRELEHKIACADVIDENLTTEGAVQYQLVGPDESDVSQGRISVSSPLGKAMIGKEVGDEIVVQAPSGQRRYELVKILSSLEQKP